MKTQIVGALLGSVPEASPRASHRGYRPSRPRRRRHRSRRSVKNRYGSWVTLPRPRPRPAQLAQTPLATISVEDREKTREMATQTSGHLEPSPLAPVATQTNSPGEQSSSTSRGTAETGSIFRGPAAAVASLEALQQQVLELQAQVTTGQEMLEKAERRARWQERRVWQLQEESQAQYLELQAQVTAGQEMELQAQVTTGQEMLEKAERRARWQGRRVWQLQEESQAQYLELQAQVTT